METGVRPSLRVVKRSRTLADEQIEVLGTIRGLGIVKAKALIERFKTLKRIANANLAELADVRGIGNKIAQHVIEVFTTPYEEAKKIKLSRKKSLIYWEQ
jgi:ERCC4-type nuclease